MNQYRLYRQPKPGEYYLIACDPAELGSDFTAIVALFKNNCEIVLTAQLKEESTQTAYGLNHLGKWFNKMTGNWPCISVERNIGLGCLSKLQELNYPNLYHQKTSFATDTPQQDSQRLGWLTTKASRVKMLDDLATVVRQKELLFKDKNLLDEMFAFIRNPKTGRPEAETSKHDDLVFATAIAFQMYQSEGYPLDEQDMSIIQEDTNRINKYLNR